MSGTFSSLSTALSALRYNQAAMDVASGNVANAGTEGYARRKIVAETVGPPAVPALWSRWDGTGDGVAVGSVQRTVDPLLDARARTEHGQQALLEGRRDVLVRLETALGEPGDSGVAAALSDFGSGWHDVANNTGDDAARSQLLARAGTLTSALATQARAVATEWSDQRTRVDALTTEVNGLASDLARVNDGIRVATVAGTDTGALMDRRDQIALRLAELVGADTVAAADGTVDVRVGGVSLVTGSNASTLQASGATTMAAATTDPVTFSIGGVAVSVSAGTLGAASSVLGGALPDYLAELDAVAATVAESVNAQHALGYDRNGAPGAMFFSGTTAATLAVALTDPDQVAASLTPGTLDGSNADVLAGLTDGQDNYRRLVTDFGSQVASARRVADNQQVLTDQIDGSREALSGVNIDEEMVNMLAHQRAYEAAARVITTLDSVLDTLINRTGLVR
ncbi:MAG TPA: flagellar hook-associated protein FlgK [Nocardioidaceae bacterium]|nr:flagellar hook-associated protein FlgK [Nocardioidaceae bacterium]